MAINSYFRFDDDDNKMNYKYSHNNQKSYGEAVY